MVIFNGRKSPLRVVTQNRLFCTCSFMHRRVNMYVTYSLYVLHVTVNDLTLSLRAVRNAA